MGSYLILPTYLYFLPSFSLILFHNHFFFLSCLCLFHNPFFPSVSVCSMTPLFLPCFVSECCSAVALLNCSLCVPHCSPLLPSLSLSLRLIYPSLSLPLSLLLSDCGMEARVQGPVWLEFKQKRGRQKQSLLCSSNIFSFSSLVHTYGLHSQQRPAWLRLPSSPVSLLQSFTFARVST